MKRVSNYFRKAYRLSLSPVKRRNIVWTELQHTVKRLGWKYSIYEPERYISLLFPIGEDDRVDFYYRVTDESIVGLAFFLEDFSEEFVTDMFILATHLNNWLSNGTVVITTSDYSIRYMLKQDILRSFLSPEEIEDYIFLHHSAVYNIIYPAFLRLLVEREAPAIIIADMLRDEEQFQSNTNGTD